MTPEQRAAHRRPGARVRARPPHLSGAGATLRRRDRSGGPAVNERGDPEAFASPSATRGVPRAIATSLAQPRRLASAQERQRAMLALFSRPGGAIWRDALTEVGCGSGGNLLELLRARLSAGTPAWHRAAGCAIRARAPRPAASLSSFTGATLPPSNSARPRSTSCSSRPSFPRCSTPPSSAPRAKSMWRWVKPGGCVLWYDFTVDNPKNPDVRGVPLRRISALFPEATIDAGAHACAALGTRGLPRPPRVSTRLQRVAAVAHACALLARKADLRSSRSLLTGRAAEYNDASVHHII